jgi:hypothetical protein
MWPTITIHCGEQSTKITQKIANKNRLPLAPTLQSPAVIKKPARHSRGFAFAPSTGYRQSIKKDLFNFESKLKKNHKYQ